MKRRSVAELTEALRSTESELSAYQVLWARQDADFVVKVEDGRTDPETWFLHATGRASGPVLRIRYGQHAPDRVMFLMEYAPTTCPYRTSALSKCHAFEIAFHTGKVA